MTAWAAGGAAAAACGLLALAGPTLVARLPEPVPDPAYADEGPKEPYASMAADRRFRMLVVLSSVAAGGWVGLVLGWDWSLLLVLPVVPAGAVLAVIDWRTRLLPSRIVLPTTGLAALLAVVCWAIERDTDALIRAALGLVVARSLFWLLWRIRSSGMGFGDVRLAGLLGLVLGHLGWGELVLGLYAGFLLFGVPGLLLAVLRRDRGMLRTAYPFGPFLLAGALVGIGWGEALWSRFILG